MPVTPRTAPHRSALGKALCPLLGALALSALTAPAAADQAVFTDALAPGWQNWSWNTTVGFAAASPAVGAASLSVRYDAPWAGLYLHSGTAIPASGFGSLRFKLHGGAGGGQRLSVTAYNTSNAEGASVSLTPAPANAWTQIDIPLTAFGVATITGLVWQDTTGGAQPTFYLDDLALAGSPPPPPPPGDGPALSIDASSDRHAISPYIYGMNFADEALAAELRLPINRWGGNSTTRYNWRLDASNHASDWYFENIPNDNPNPAALPDGSSSDRFIDQNRRTGTDSLITVPLIGFTPKSRAYAGGFQVSRYGAQQSVDPYRPDIGNGIRPNGAFVTGNDPADTSIAAPPQFVADWIAHLRARYGPASPGPAGAVGVRFYNLDNEPMLWNSTHRDVHPQGTGYDEILQRTVAYAAAVKAADPGAKTLGPAEWGWTGYFYSGADQAAGGAWWNTRPDRMAHGDTPLVPWYLAQLRADAQARGARLLDYLDLHFYPQAAGVSLSSAGDAATRARRLRTSRSLWDPTYTDESWIAEPVYLIPRMRGWVTGNYPGTGLAVSEYNFGGLEDINGALTQADVLGIFGREGLDLATIWAGPTAAQPGAFAFRVFRTYDGAGAAFGETGVRAASADQSRVSIYAALAGASTLTAVLINKADTDLTSTLTLAGFPVSGPARLYRYSEADLSHVVRLADAAVSTAPAGAALTLPARSITLLAIPGRCAADWNVDGEVNGNDISDYINSWYGDITTGTTVADFNTDGETNGNDISDYINAWYAAVVNGGAC